MPTGTGKTTLFAEIIRRCKVNNKRCLIIVHRIELVIQIYERLKHFGVDSGLIVSGQQPIQCNIQIATIQTISRRILPETDLIIIDEAHHSKADSYKKIVDNYPNAHILGVTATPIRMSGEGFEDIFDVLIESEQIEWFIQNKYLSPVKQYACSVIDLSRVKKSKGDYDIKEINNIMTAPEELNDLVEGYINHAYNKKMIVFAVSVEHSLIIESLYNKKGIPCKHIDATTDKKIRDKILNDFKQNKIKILTNVDIISEGFDVPDCEAVQLARPTKSLALYLQQAGRAMRPMQGKDFAIVLDNANCWKNHGLVEIDRTWSLHGCKKVKKNYDVDYDCVCFDSNGIIHKMDEYSNIKNVELVPITKDLAQCVYFEQFFQTSLEREYKPLSAYYRYKDLRGNNLTNNEFEYIQKRIKSTSNAPNKGFWFYEKQNIVSKP